MPFDPQNPTAPLRLLLLACEIFHRDLCRAVALSPHIIDIRFLSQGLHDIRSENMSARLQAELEAVSAERYDAVLLGFALCNNGIVGIGHPGLPLVVPRAHDCIALFLGSRGAYDRVFHENPGTYFKTSGWIERDDENLENVAQEPGDNPFGALRTFEQYVEQYGEENARYLAETLGGLHNYNRMAFIQMPGLEALPHAEATRAEAERLGLNYAQLPGSDRWLRRLCDGPWDDEDFLVLEPGQRVAASNGPDILRAD